MVRIALLLLVLTGCSPVLVTPEQVAVVCQEKARSAQGPTGSASFGTNSRTGGFGSVEIGISSDFIAGRDQVEVYKQCFFDRTGELPILPPVLR